MNRIIWGLLLLVGLLAAGCNLPQPHTPTPLIPTVTTIPTLTFLPTDPPPTSTPEATATVDPLADSLPGVDVTIEGSAEFRAQTIRALEMYHQCAPEALAEADNSLVKIQEFDRSGMDVYDGTFEVASPTAFVEGYLPEVQIFWYGGAIIHDSRHRWQHLNGINTNWAELDLSGRESIEMDARGVQIEAMKSCLSAVPESERYQAEYLLQYLEDIQSGTLPCDYCKVDYSDRDW